MRKKRTKRSAPRAKSRRLINEELDSIVKRLARETRAAQDIATAAAPNDHVDLNAAVPKLLVLTRALDVHWGVLRDLGEHLAQVANWSSGRAA